MEYTVSKASQTLGLSIPNIYKKIRKHHRIIQKHIRRNSQNHMILTDEALEIIRADNPNYQPDNGHQDRLSADNLVNNDRIMNLLESSIDGLNNIIKEKDNQINELIQGQKRHDTIVMSLTSQIKEQNQMIEDFRNQTEESKVISPEKPKKKLIKPEPVSTPEEIKPSFKQKIIYFFNPHLQRKRA